MHSMIDETEKRRIIRAFWVLAIVTLVGFVGCAIQYCHY
jgi:hypothetical protein